MSAREIEIERETKRREGEEKRWGEGEMRAPVAEMMRDDRETTSYSDR